MKYNPRDESSIKAVMAKANVVLNLIGMGFPFFILLVKGLIFFFFFFFFVAFLIFDINNFVDRKRVWNKKLQLWGSESFHGRTTCHGMHLYLNAMFLNCQKIGMWLIVALLRRDFFSCFFLWKLPSFSCSIRSFYVFVWLVCFHMAFWYYRESDSYYKKQGLQNWRAG